MAFHVQGTVAESHHVVMVWRVGGVHGSISMLTVQMTVTVLVLLDSALSRAASHFEPGVKLRVKP